MASAFDARRWEGFHARRDEARKRTCRPVIAAVAAPKKPYTVIEGAHLRPSAKSFEQLAQEIAEADRQWEDAYDGGDAA